MYIPFESDHLRPLLVRGKVAAFIVIVVYIQEPTEHKSVRAKTPKPGKDLVHVRRVRLLTLLVSAMQFYKNFCSMSWF